MAAKQKAIFVIGPESSGSTFVAKVIAANLGKPDWNGRGFDCCDDAFCDEGTGYVQPCKAVDPILCHRSLPFAGNRYPPLSEWLDLYDCYFVICTRDVSVSEYSRMSRSGKSRQRCQEETRYAGELIASLLEGHPSRCWIFSYETHVFLKDLYLRALFDFLDIEFTGENDAVKDQNAKYVVSRRLASRMDSAVQKVSRMFAR